MSVQDDLEELRGQVHQLQTYVGQLHQQHATEVRNLRDEWENYRQVVESGLGRPGPPGRDIDTEAVIARIKTDPQLRELLRGPRGLPGTDGKPGPQGDAGATVIREQRVVG